MNAAEDTRKRVVILGGGTAGWIAANGLIDRWAAKGVEITLVESPDIGTVGVGEGSTPRLKAFFDAIGIGEADWMPSCNATYKNGISFVNWSTRPGFDHYFHPFATELDSRTRTAFFFNTLARRQGVDVHAHPDRFFLSARLAENRLCPIPAENFPFTVEYGYHFDAHRVGEFLKRKAKLRGVRHVEAKVQEINQAANGDVESLSTDTGATITGDFFIDCSGFRGSIIQETLGVRFLPFSDNLFNDSAVVLPTEQEAEIGCQTISTAMRYGWAWKIPLTHRNGNGYVYSSAFCSADEAEMELRMSLGLLDSDVEARHLKMKVGQVENHWYRNCLAVGLSQGFIEPLEATALNLVCNTVYAFIDIVEESGFGADSQAELNRLANRDFQTVRDYIVAHYIMNSRNDTDYWRQNGENTNVSDTLKRILTIWKTGQNLAQEMEQKQIDSTYTVQSWYCLLAGYGFYPETRPVPGDHPAFNKFDMVEIDEFIRCCALNFPSHNEQLENLQVRQSQEYL